MQVIYGSRVRIWGDTCGGVCEFANIAFEFSGGRPSRGSPLKIGTAYSLGIFLGCEFFQIFSRKFFLSLKQNQIENN